MSSLTPLDKVKIGIELESNLDPDTVNFVQINPPHVPSSITRTGYEVFNHETQAMQCIADYFNYCSEEIVKIGKTILYQSLGTPIIGRDGGGIEIRFVPMTFSEFKANFKTISDILKRLRQLGFQVKNSQSAGIHVHIDRSFFNALSAKRIAQFIASNQEFFKRYTNRLERVHYNCDIPAQSPVLTGKDGNNPINFDDAIIRQRFPIDLHKKGNTYTLEFRIFNSVLEPSRFASFIEFCLYSGLVAAKDTYDGSTVMKYFNQDPEAMSSFPNLTRELTHYGIIPVKVPVLQTM